MFGTYHLDLLVNQKLHTYQCLCSIQELQLSFTVDLPCVTLIFICLYSSKLSNKTLIITILFQREMSQYTQLKNSAQFIHVKMNTTQVVQHYSYELFVQWKILPPQNHTHYYCCHLVHKHAQTKISTVKVPRMTCGILETFFPILTNQ